MEKIILESLGISSEVKELADTIIREFEELYNSGNDRERILWGELRDNNLNLINKSNAERILYINNNSYFNDVIQHIEIVCYVFQTLEDFYRYKQAMPYGTPYYNFEDKKVFLPIQCTINEIPFEAIKEDTRSILEHELMHAYQSSKLNSTVGNDLYFKAVHGMQNKFPDNRLLENLVCQIIYFSSLFEIDAQAHNLFVNLKKEAPKNFNDAKKVKPYFWINIVKNMINNAKMYRNDERLKDGLNYLGLDWKQFEAIFNYGIKYRRRKFDRILTLYMNESNIMEKRIINGDSGNIGPDNINQIFKEYHKSLDESVDYLIENIY